MTRTVRRCPRTWPHDRHGPWSTAELVPGAAIYDTTFDCPGVPLPDPKDGKQ